jgi:hypothetical protein
MQKQPEVKRKKSRNRRKMKELLNASIIAWHTTGPIFCCRKESM